MGTPHDKGVADKNAGKGQKDPTTFKSDKERKEYQAGWNKGQ